MPQYILEKHTEKKTEPLLLSMSQTNSVMGLWKLFQIKTEGEFEVQQLFWSSSHKGIASKNKNILQKAASRSLYYKPMFFPPNEGKACY